MAKSEEKRVVFSFPEYGYDSDVEKAKKLLYPNNIYKMIALEVCSSISYITLEGFPGVVFNSVQFEGVGFDLDDLITDNEEGYYFF